MRNLSKAIVGTLLGAAVGCSSDYGPRYVERVPVAGPDAPNTRPYELEPVKPMPERSGQPGPDAR